MIIVMILSLVLMHFSCSNVDMQSTSEDIQIAKERILKLAAKYSLNVTVNDEDLEGIANRINYEKLERNFESLAAIKGEYTFFVESVTDSTKVYSQKKKRILKRSIGALEEKTYIQGRIVDNYNCSCKATIYYYDDYSHNASADIEASVSSVSGIDGSSSYTIYRIEYAPEYVAFRGSATFYQEVSDYEINPSPAITVSFTFDGVITPTQGNITWG